LDVTVGGATANSYISEVDASSYFDERLNVGAWTAAVSDDRARALISATRWVDTQWFKGDKATKEQALEFPRDGDDVIPVAVQWAVCEVVLALLAAGTTDLLAVDSTAGVKRKKVDVLETEYWGPQDRPTGLEKVPQAIRFLAPYLAGSGSGLAVERV
jgi:hypothetical protein